jgi:hypothetical protein
VDILQAERLYSQFAFEALLVEGNGDGADLESLLFEFIGLDEVVELSDVRDALGRGGVTEEEAQERITNQLLSLSFLGQEVHEDEYEFAENPRDRRRIDGLAQRLAATRGRAPRFQIHPAYQAYLDISGEGAVKQKKLPLTTE